MHLEAVAERVWRYVLGGHDRANLEAAIKQFGGCTQAGLEMHLEAVIERVWRCTWRPWSSEFGDMYLEAMIV